jgi:transposase-like protein
VAVAAGSLEIDSPKPNPGRDTTAVKKPYHIVSREAETAAASLEALSAAQIAGPRTQGKSSGDIRWHGSQKGRASVADRQIKVNRPRLRHKQADEVSVPAYESLQEDSATAQRILGALLRGVSTREYAEVLPEKAESAGVSHSSVSREAIEESIEQLQQLRGRRWDEADLLVLYIDGQRFGSHHVISALGIDRNGSKHVLGIRWARHRKCGGGEAVTHELTRPGSANRPQVSVCH